MYDVVTNPIPKSDVYSTKTIDDIYAIVDAMPPKDKVVAYNIMMMTLNACHKLVDTEILSRDIFAG